MTTAKNRSQLGLERLQIAHKIAELNKAYGAIPRGAQGSSSVGREIRKLVERQTELEAQLEQPSAEATSDGDSTNQSQPKPERKLP